MSPQCRCTSERRDRHRGRARLQAFQKASEVEHDQVSSHSKVKYNQVSSHSKVKYNQVPRSKVKYNQVPSHSKVKYNQAPHSKVKEAQICSSAFSPISLRGGSACGLPNQIHSKKADLSLHIVLRCSNIPCTYLIFVIFLHQHILRPENFTLKSA